MHFPHLISALFLLGIPSVLGTEFDFADRALKWEKDRKAAFLRQRQQSTFQEDVPDENKFLSDKTSPYKVNGTAFPFADFNIGESYAGLLPVGNSKKDELFFWFFPTKGAGANDITIWLNGGPGCSSLVGLLEENGPFVWLPGEYGPKINPYSYNKLSNVVWVEQPVGTGYTMGNPVAMNEKKVAEQFNAFWKNFVDLFELYHYNVYITGESYAGQYVPYIGDGMLNETDPKRFNLKGIQINDPVVGPGKLILPPAVPFVLANKGSFPFEPSFMEELLKAQESCGYTKIMNEGLTFPPKGRLPDFGLKKGCDTYDAIYDKIYEMNPCFNIYHVSETCPEAGDILGGIVGPGSPAIKALQTPYFDRSDVKKLLHVPTSKSWSECSGGVLPRDKSRGSATNNGPVARIAEAIGNVLVGHGTQDYILLSNQTLLTLNDLKWNGKQGFESGPTKPFWVPQNFGKKGKYKYMGTWTESRGITFNEVNLSGHMIPEFQPGAAYRQLEYLLGRVKSLADKVPFTS